MKNWFFIEDLGTAPTQNVERLGAETVDDYFGGSSTTHSFSYNRTGGTNDGILVLVASSNPTNSVTYDGASLTLIDDVGFSNAGVSAWVGGSGLSTGSNTVVITHSSATSASVGFAVGLQYFDDVDTVATGLTDNNVGNLTSSSLNLTPSEFSLVVDVVGKSSGFGSSLNGDGNQTGFYVNVSSNSIISNGSWNSVQTGANVTLAHTWGGGGDNTGHLILELKGKA